MNIKEPIVLESEFLLCGVDNALAQAFLQDAVNAVKNAIAESRQIPYLIEKDGRHERIRTADLYRVMRNWCGMGAAKLEIGDTLRSEHMW